MRSFLALAALVGTALMTATPTLADVKSSLYPENWVPGFADAQGRFLHDFSYAGYHKSEIPLPVPQGQTFDVTKAPYNADNTGNADVTAAIQQALDAAANAGGGIVYLPEGTYKLTFIDPKHDYAIRLHSSNTVLKGDGLKKTHLYLDETVSRQKAVVLMRPDAPPWWFNKNGEGTLITQDLTKPTLTLPMSDVKGFTPGQLVVVRSDFTQGFIDDVKMTGKWLPTSNMRGITLLRRVVSVDPANSTLTIDAPTRYPMKTRDALRVYPLADANMRESALEGFSIAMKQNPKPGLEEEAYSKEGTAGYDVHMSSAVTISGAEDCWARDIGTYNPPGNPPNIDIHSHGLRLLYSRQVTITNCDFRNAEYHGGGGNGYLYTFSSNDCLIRDSIAVNGRHNFDFQNMWCIGNVAFHNTIRDGSLPSDYHMFLSTGNLVDNMTVDHDMLECRYRPYAKPLHGESGSQNVFWNTNGLSYSAKHHYVVDSRQFGIGYVIGTRGPANAVNTQTDDFIDCVGQGDELNPQSLWIDQLNRRTGEKKCGDARLAEP